MVGEGERGENRMLTFSAMQSLYIVKKCKHSNMALVTTYDDWQITAEVHWNLISIQQTFIMGFRELIVYIDYSIVSGNRCSLSFCRHYVEWFHNPHACDRQRMKANSQQHEKRRVGGNRKRREREFWVRQQNENETVICQRQAVLSAFRIR